MKKWLNNHHCGFFIAYGLIIFVVTFVNYLPFIIGSRLFYHDSLVEMTVIGIFYDRILSGDSWLWSTSLNAGHPLWMAIETAPFWDPIALIIYGISAALNVDWQTPYQITVFVWLLLFALGGSACARYITGSKWAGLLAFLLLYGGPAANMIPAQSLGYLVPFRYFPFVLLAYLCLRREVTVGNSFLLSATLAVSLAGYNSAFSLFSLIVIAIADLLVSRRDYFRWMREICRMRYAVFLLIPFLAALPTIIFLYQSQDFVIIPREFTFELVYFFDFNQMVSQLL
jgi:hypothetical protein